LFFDFAAFLWDVARESLSQVRDVFYTTQNERITMFGSSDLGRLRLT